MLGKGIVRVINISLIISILVLIFIYIKQAETAVKGETTQGTVMQVKDGDTVVVSPAQGGQFFTCRLYGIDTPEKKQPYGEEATKELKKLVLGQTVTVETTGAKTYNREVCIIKKDGMDINLEMVKRGMAWAYIQYLKRPHASIYIEAEKEARDKKLGLWKESNPTPPWEWRKRNR